MLFPQNIREDVVLKLFKKKPSLNRQDIQPVHFLALLGILNKQTEASPIYIYGQSMREDLAEYVFGKKDDEATSNLDLLLDFTAEIFPEKIAVMYDFETSLIDEDERGGWLTQLHMMDEEIEDLLINDCYTTGPRPQDVLHNLSNHLMRKIRVGIPK